MIDKIFVDLDGVLCDFQKRYKQIFGVAPESLKYKQFHQQFDKFIIDMNFATLDMMPDTLKLLSVLDSLEVPKEILSSTASESRHDVVSKQKIIWLKKHGITYKQNFVPGKSLKYKFATPNSIIIDDTVSVIEDWNKAGGIGILHKSAETTIDKLKSLML
jgi:5' nucleotidase, deoxy (Pyrimidine), cytosolic type C protein (NT5C)